jgi:hypothetical protein
MSIYMKKVSADMKNPISHNAEKLIDRYLSTFSQYHLLELIECVK